MRQIAIIIFILFVAGSVFAKDVHVKGHYRDTDGDGYKETYVEPHYRTAPDNNRYNNYSTEGNSNPYTGERGYVNPDQNSSQPRNNNYNTKSLYRR